MSTVPAVIEQPQIDPGIYSLLSKFGETNTEATQKIYDYIVALKSENVAVLGVDECFKIKDYNGQIKAFKRVLHLSEVNGYIGKPGLAAPFSITAQGYEYWADNVGAACRFPSKVIVNGEFKNNPYVEKDPQTKKIVAVYVRAEAFKYSDTGSPQKVDWTTMYDVPAYRLIDLLAKAKKLPQAFKLLPADTKPKVTESNETWAVYPFDGSANLWLNTSHKEVLGWFSMIINREKKVIDYAQTFARRNAFKHLSALQKTPENINAWNLPVICWNIRWTDTEYTAIENRISNSETTGEIIDIKVGFEQVDDDVAEEEQVIEVKPKAETTTVIATIERPAEITIERPAETTDEKPAQQELSPEDKKVFQNLETTKVGCPSEYEQACENLSINPAKVETVTDAVRIVSEIEKIIDAQD